MKIRSVIVLSCVLLSSLCAPATAYTEGIYVITENELTTLEKNLATLKKQREMLLEELVKLNIQQDELEQRLKESKALSQKAEAQLQIANKSLEEYAKEEKSRLRRAKTERTIWCIVSAGLLYAYVTK